MSPKLTSKRNSLSDLRTSISWDPCIPSLFLQNLGPQRPACPPYSPQQHIRYHQQSSVAVWSMSSALYTKTDLDSNTHQVLGLSTKWSLSDLIYIIHKAFWNWSDRNPRGQSITFCIQNITNKHENCAVLSAQFSKKHYIKTSTFFLSSTVIGMGRKGSEPQRVIHIWFGHYGWIRVCILVARTWNSFRIDTLKN